MERLGGMVDSFSSPTPPLPKYDTEVIYSHRESTGRIWGGCHAVTGRALPQRVDLRLSKTLRRERTSARDAMPIATVDRLAWT